MSVINDPQKKQYNEPKQEQLISNTAPNQNVHDNITWFGIVAIHSDDCLGTQIKTLCIQKT